MACASSTTACIDAYRLLFGSEPEPSTWQRVSMDALKRAYRKQALRFHPDRARAVGSDEHELTRRFQAVSAAYDLLRGSLRSLASPSAQPRRASPPPRRRSTTYRPTPRRPEPRPSSEPQWYRQAREAERKAAAESQSAATSSRWCGDLPRRRLMFAEFLYYSGAVSWRDFVEALVWQTRSRPMFGRLAVERGYLERDDICRIILERPRHERFGEYAVRAGYMQEVERLIVLAMQSAQSQPIGQYFLERGLIANDTLKTSLRRQVLHNALYASRRPAGSSAA